MIKKLPISLLIFIFHFTVSAQKTFNVISGDWSVAANWTPAGAPSANDEVIIPSGKTVNININATAKSVSVSGILKMSNAQMLTVGSNAVWGDIIVNSGGSFTMGSGSDLATLIVYGNYINNGVSDFWKSDVVIVGNLLSPATSELQKQGNVVVGGNIIGAFNITGSEVGVIYAVNPNATVTISPQSLDNNVTPGTPVPSTTENTVLSALVNSVLYGTNCDFTITGTSNTNTCVGNSAVFSAVTTGVSPSYQWEINMGNGWRDLANDSNFSGVTTTNLTVSSVAPAMNNYKFRVRITAAGCTERGNYGFLTVNDSPLIITQPTDELDCEGNIVSFKVTASGNGTLVYKWQWKKPSETAFTDIPADTKITYPSAGIVRLENVGSTLLPNLTQFQAVVSIGNCSVKSLPAKLTVNELIAITSPALTPSQSIVNVNLCYGSNYSYHVTISNPSNGAVNYQWKRQVAGGNWENVVDGSHFSGSQTATLNIVNGTPNESAKYRVDVVFMRTGGDCIVNSYSKERLLTFLPQLIMPSTVIVKPSCANINGEITVAIQSTSDMYSFNNGETYQSSNVITGLASGNYKVIIKNVLGCTSPVANCDVTGTIVSTYNGNVWSPRAPTSIDKIIINGSYTSNGDLLGCSCLINSGTVVISSGNAMILDNELTVSGGSLTFENNASLVQKNSSPVVNTGSIIYKRESSPIINDDYTYWSSPTNGTQTLLEFSPNTQSDKFFIFDNNWANESTSNTFQPGIGYSIRAPEGTSATTAAKVPFQFGGIPNNGAINIAVTAQQDEFGQQEGIRLVGNPYPSAIDADAFIDANITGSGTINKTITGTLYFWTHNHTLVGNDYLATDYATYTKFGGTGTNSAISGTGNNNTPSKYIAAGQGFFVEVDATGNVSFNNSMRSSAENANFYKQVKTKASVAQSHRIWLNLTNSTKNFSQALMGYSTMATNGYDKGVDGISFDGDQHSIYSLIGERMLTIQAKAMPFDDSDAIPIGYSVNVAGKTSISMDRADGLFLDSQNIYLEDLKLGVVHDIKALAYEFTSDAGTFDNRFILRFKNTDKSLGTKNQSPLKSTVTVVNINKQVRIDSTTDLIDSVKIFDIAGRLIYQKQNIGSQNFLLSGVVPSNQMLVFKIVLQNGTSVTRKTLF